MLTRVAQELFSVAGWDFEIFQDDQGQYSFHGATVCDYFEIKNASVAIQRHVDEEWRFKAPIELGKGSDSWMIKEPGLYQLAMLSKTPMAKRFQRWVYSEVLPKLRADGGYIRSDATSEQLKGLQSQIAEQQLQLKIRDKAIADFNATVEFQGRINSYLRKLDKISAELTGRDVEFLRLSRISRLEDWAKQIFEIFQQDPDFWKSVAGQYLAQLPQTLEKVQAFDRAHWKSFSDLRGAKLNQVLAEAKALKDNPPFGYPLYGQSQQVADSVRCWAD